MQSQECSCSQLLLNGSMVFTISLEVLQQPAAMTTFLPEIKISEKNTETDHTLIGRDPSLSMKILSINDFSFSIKVSSKFLSDLFIGVHLKSSI